MALNRPLVIERLSVRSLLLRARLGLSVALFAVLALAVYGVVALAAPPQPPPLPTVPDVATKQAVMGFAEVCARQYLTWDSRYPDRHARSLDQCTADGELARGLGFQVPESGFQDANWVTPIRTQEVTSTESLVTVEAGTTSGTKWLVLPVRRVIGKGIVLSGYPALVGPPKVDASVGGEDLEPVEDAALQAVAQRSLRNYLAGDSRNLSSDLASDAEYSMPRERLTVTSSDPAAWIEQPNFIQLVVGARAHNGASYELRYELEVLRRGARWVVQRIQTTPTLTQGVSP